MSRPYWFSSVSSLILLLASALTVTACRGGDSRFDGAPSISAHDVRSHNLSRLAPKQPPPRIPPEPTAAPIPSEGQSAPQQLPPNHPVAGEGGTAMPRPSGDSPVRPDANAFSYASPSQYGKIGPLRWVAPDGWRGVKPANAFRIAEYVIPGSNGTHSATMSIFHFPGGGGGIQANISRWLSQFTPSGDGKSSTTTMTVAGLKVWRVTAAGLYNPGMAGGANGVREDYALKGAIVESSIGPFFFKLVGPRPTLEGASSDFEQFVQSFRGATDSQ